MKIVWKVQAAPTGRYRSFQQRGWPQAFRGTPEGDILVSLHCDDDYVPENARSGKHAPIRVHVAVRKGKVRGWDWKRLSAQFATLDEAKRGGGIVLPRAP